MSVVRQQLRNATDITLMDEARAARAQVALGLARLVSEVVPTTRGIALEALRSFAKALGRVLNQNVSVLIPVNQRNTNSNNDGNCVSLARFTIAVDEARENLNGLKKRLHSTLMHARRDPDKLGILLPLVPFIPKRLFARAGQLALGAFTDLPITCSNLGELPEDVLKIDGTSAEDICCRGVDRPLTLSAIEARGGVATLFAGVIPGFLALSFVAYQPGVVTETHQLHQLVKEVLKRYELTGEYFDD